MKYLIKIELVDKTRMYCVINAESKEVAKNKCFSIYQELYNKRVLMGKKYRIKKDKMVEIEKWNSNNKNMGQGSPRIFSVLLVGPTGLLSKNEVSASGIKSAYNRYINSSAGLEKATVFLYDTTQKADIRTKSTYKAKKTLQSKSDTIDVLKKGCEKSKQVSQIEGLEWVDNITLICNMIYDYCKGTYKKVPMNVIIGLTAAVIYFVCPIDLIPDFIPIIGQVDDVYVIKLALKCCHRELMEYKAWKEEQGQVA